MTGAIRSAPDRNALTASPRLFRNPILEKLSRVHHLAPAAIYPPIALLLLRVAFRHLGPAAIVALAVGGYFSWTAVEYLGHRFLFHLDLTSEIGERIHFLIHGVHHVHPSDPLRLVMPPLMSAPIMFAAFVVSRLVFGPTLTAPLLAGFLGGYVAYDMLHYHLHHGRPRTRWGAALRRRHMHHHFQDGSRGFGISCPWWDDIVGVVSKNTRA